MRRDRVLLDSRILKTKDGANNFSTAGKVSWFLRYIFSDIYTVNVI